MRNALAGLLVLCALSPAAAIAQQGLLPAPEGAPAQQGLLLTPALSLTQIYDDQFATPGAPAGAGFLAVAGPRVGLLYGGERLNLLANAAADLAMIESQVLQGVPYRRWALDGALSGKATERLTLLLRGSLLDSSSPRDVSLITGLDQGLVHLQAGGGGAGIAYALTELASASIDGGVNLTRQGGLDQNDALVRATTTDRFSARDTGRLQLLLRWYTFDRAPATATTAALAGWDRILTEELRVEVLAGPRFSSGALEGVEGSVSLRWEQPRLDLALLLSSTQGAVPGLAGLVDTASASLHLVLRPTSHLTLTATPAAYRSWGPPLEARVLELRLDAAQVINPWLSLLASYRFSAQDVVYTAVAIAPGAATHHQLALGVSFRAPSSTDAAPERARPPQRQ